MFRLLIFFILIHKLRCENPEFPLLGEMEGVAERENFTYYSIYHSGNILLILYTIYGDADIYISQKNPVSYDPNEYDLHSATCGADSVVIPKSFKRPIFVGIYGHAGFEKSPYILRAFKLPDTYNNQFYDSYKNEEIPEEDNIQEDDEVKETEPTTKKEVKHTKTTKKKISISKDSGLWAVLEIFQLIFL